MSPLSQIKKFNFNCFSLKAMRLDGEQMLTSASQICSCENQNAEISYVSSLKFQKGSQQCLRLYFD